MLGWYVIHFFLFNHSSKEKKRKEKETDNRGEKNERKIMNKIRENVKFKTSSSFVWFNFLAITDALLRDSKFNKRNVNIWMIFLIYIYIYIYIYTAYIHRLLKMRILWVLETKWMPQTANNIRNDWVGKWSIGNCARCSNLVVLQNTTYTNQKSF